VSLSGNGSTVAVGAPHNDDGGVDAGQVRTFRWDGSSWTQLGDALNGEDTWDRWLNDKFGYSVSLSGDGSAVAVGSPYNGKKYRPQMGQVRTFRWDGSSWTQLGDALNGKSTCDNFGYSVSLSGDGSTVAVGAPRNNDGGVDAGQVRTFRWDGSSWTQLGDALNGTRAFGRFGTSVSLSGDGSAVAVGAPRNNDGGVWAGQVRTFRWDGSSWTQLGDALNGKDTCDTVGAGEWR